MELRQLAIQLEKRRLQLGISCAAVAQRTGLGLRTVQRALSDNSVQPEFGTLATIAGALGASIVTTLKTVETISTLKQRQARLKADRLVSLTQGTSALEAQAIPKRALARMKQKTVSDLLHGSNRRLWAED